MQAMHVFDGGDAMTFDNCDNAFVEVLLINLYSMVINLKTMTIMSGEISIIFTEWISVNHYTCVIDLVLRFMRRVKIKLNCSSCVS